MKALTLHATWQPREGYSPSAEEERTRRARSGSMVWRRPSLALGEATDPQIQADEVLIRVAAVGICGSDMHMYEADDQGYMLYPGLTRFPNILGHEFAGRVVAVGDEVKTLRVGALVTAEEIQWCGLCGACRRGLVNHCTRMEELGFTTPGAMAQLVKVKAKYCWPLDEIAERRGSEEEALILGAMVEPSGVSYHAMFNRLSSWRPGMAAAVFGAGPIGLAAIALAAAAGASRIIAFDPSSARRAMASRLGASDALDPTAVDPNEALLELTRGRGADFVIEAAGAPRHTLTPLKGGLAVGAAIVHIGRSEHPTPLALEQYQLRGVQLAGSLGHAGHGTFPAVIRLLASGRLDLRPMVSATLPLTEATAAFKRLESRQDAKIILLPND